MRTACWSAAASSISLRLPDVLPMANSGYRRMNMEMLETQSTSLKRQVWNAGRTVGAKRALKPKQFGRSVSTSIIIAAFETEPCSTSQSTASCVAVISCK
jgi:hypothetical protein